MAFFRRVGSGTFHTTTACSKVPKNVKTNKDWKTLKSRPKAKKCAECTNKEKSAVKAPPKGKGKAAAKGKGKKK